MLSPDRPQDVDEVFIYVSAMNHGLARLEATPISIGLLREIHRELLAGTRGHALAPGELRTTQNWIGPSGSPLEATFVPPPQEVPRALARLERFVQDGAGLPLLIKVGLARA